MRLLLGDCLDVLAELDDASVHAVVTDPPYGLEFMGKDWDAPWRGDGVVDADVWNQGVRATRSVDRVSVTARRAVMAPQRTR